MGRAGPVVLALLAVAAGFSALPAGAAAAAPRSELVAREAVAPGVERLRYRYGPLVAAPGQNLIMAGPVTLERPVGEGFVTRIKPDLVRGDGSPPPVENVHMHHAALLNLSRPDLSSPGLPERFYAFAEEKTVGILPPGFGYRVRPADVWAINYMLHNGTPESETVWVVYEIDWIAADSPLGQRTRGARPLWLDVQNGKAYPVFDANRWDGGLDRKLTYPDEVHPSPYGDGAPLNEWTVDRDSILIQAAGHVHPGGLWTDLEVEREGRRQGVFRSEARYWHETGPVSWDMAMTVSPESWRVALRRGDRLRVSATYETARATWHEAMGLMLTYLADGTDGPDPFAEPVVTRGDVTHGHLPEAGNHGGRPTGLPDPASLPEARTLDRRVGIAGFRYTPGDLSVAGPLGHPPAIDPGQGLRFGNPDAAAQVPHTVTACKAPCTASTGLSYPLADGDVAFDSGQLGYGPEGFTAAAQRSEWELPRDLEPGTYTYFCRVHPYMRGALRVRGESPPRELRLTPRSLRVSPGGRLRLDATCGGRRGGACAGTVVVRRGRRVLGRVAIEIPAGRTEPVAVKLSRRFRRHLRRAGRLRATLTAEVRDAPPVRRRLRLRRAVRAR